MNSKPSSLLSLAVCLGITLLAGLGNVRGADKTNVLFIVSDDLAARLGCYGDPLAKTPHLDGLAKQGVLFERAYCQFPLCSPSRTSFLTGLRPDKNGVVNNSSHFRTHLPEHITLPQAYRKAGYFTARVGKLYHYAVPAQIGTDGADDAPSWDKAINPKGRDVADQESIVTLRPDLEGAARYAGSLSWLAADGTDAEQTDGMTAREAARFMEEKRHEPFFLAVGFFRPHTPYVAPKKYFDLYPLEGIPLPTAPKNVKELFPAAALTLRKDQEQMTDLQRRQAIQAYLASVSFMDAQVGHLLEALERLKLREKTIVVFLSDHGYHLGEKGQWQKMSLFEESARVPLIISAPGMTKGVKSPRTVELLDLYPTLADLCGIRPLSKPDGISLRPLLQNPSAPWDKPALTQQSRGVPVGTFDTGTNKAKSAGYMGYSLRTERWRYTEWDEGRKGVELYDHQNDPLEMKNLASEEAHRKIREELKSQLATTRPPR